MAKTRVRKNIEIERNIVERTIMDLREFVKGNRKTTVKVLVAVGVLSALLIAGLIYYSNHLEKHLVIYEKIMDYYEKNREKDPQAAKKTIQDLKTLSGSVRFGFISEIVPYNIGNLYYREKNYDEARKYLLQFAENTSSEVLASISLNKAAIAMEESGKINRALEIYKIIETDYSDSVIADQAYYNIGRLHLMKKDFTAAKKYFNRVISLFPRSKYAEKAKTRLYLAGAGS